MKEKLLEKINMPMKGSPLKEGPQNYKNSDIGSGRTSSRASTMRPKRILLSRNPNGTFMNNMNHEVSEDPRNVTQVVQTNESLYGQKKWNMLKTFRGAYDNQQMMPAYN